MKKKPIYKKTLNPESTFTNSVPKTRSTYHPLGYYLLGGIDVDGSNTRDCTDVGFDDFSEVGEGISVDIRTDPRASMFDVIEAIGVTKFNDAVEKAKLDGTPKND